MNSLEKNVRPENNFLMSMLGVALLSLIIFAIIISTWFSIEKGVDHLTRKRISNQKLHLELVKSQIRGKLYFFQDLAITLAQSGDFREFNLPKIERLLHQVTLNNKLISGAWVTDMTGKIQVSNLLPGSELLSSMIHPNPQKVLRLSHPFKVCAPIFDESTLSYHLPIEVIIKDELFIPKGSLMLTIRLGFLRKLAAIFKNHQKTHLTVTDREGTVLFSWNTKFLYSQANIAKSHLPLLNFFGKNRPGSVTLQPESKGDKFSLSAEESSNSRGSGSARPRLDYGEPVSFGTLWFRESGQDFLLAYENLNAEGNPRLPSWGLILSSQSSFFDSLNLQFVFFHLFMGILALVGVLFLARQFLSSKG